MDFDAFPTIFRQNSATHTIIHRNDTDLQAFTKYYKSVSDIQVKRYMNDRDISTKSKFISRKYRQEGNDSFKNKKYTRALHEYNKSISQAPRDSEEFGLAIGNRSAVLFSLSSFEDCLSDINLLLRTEYPENLRYKIYFRQAQCYQNLNIFDKASECIKKAQTSFEAAKSGIGRVQIELFSERLENFISTLNKEPVDIQELDKKDEEEQFVLKDGEHPKYLNTSAALSIMYTNDSYKGVIANVDIKQGDILFIDEPYSFVFCDKVDTMMRNDIYRCQYCLKNCLLTAIPCTQCTQTVYCSDNCRQINWDIEHRWICVGDRKGLLNAETTLSLKILLRGSQKGFNTVIKDSSKFGDKEDNYPFVNKLATKKEEIDMRAFRQALGMATWLVMYLKNCTDFFDYLYARVDRPEGSLNDLYMLIGSYLFKHSLQTRYNVENIKINKISHKENYRTASIIANHLGYGLYLSSSTMNHSCVPNTMNCFFDNLRIVRAVKDIKKGSEITTAFNGINYIELDRSDRQEILTEKLIKCNCFACTENPSAREFLYPWLCPQCFGRAYNIGDNDKFAKCSICCHKFSLKSQKKTINKYILHLVQFKINDEFRHLEVAYKQIKKVYHKYHKDFEQIYLYYLRHYHENYDYKNSVSYAELINDLCKNLYGEYSIQYTSSIMQLAVHYAKYCSIMRLFGDPNERKIYEQALEINKKSTELMKLFVKKRDTEAFIKFTTDLIQPKVVVTANEDNDRFAIDFLCGLNM